MRAMEGLLATVTELRTAALAQPRIAERFQKESALGEGLKQLVLLQENYPQLKADANFRDLAAKLVAIEDALQAARRFYNGAVKQYRNALESSRHDRGQLLGFGLCVSRFEETGSTPVLLDPHPHYSVASVITA